MMYSNAQYVKNALTGEVDGIRVDINGITSFVPLDPANTDYENIRALVASGELTIAPATEAPND
jgi:hypothetical protein